VSDVPPLAGELRLAVHRLTRRLRQQTPTDGLTLTQLSALTVIWREGPLTAGDLAAKEQVRPPSITRVLTGLEALELVQRLENPRDGRQVLVQITPLGANRMSEYVRARELWLEQQLAALSPSDRDLLRQATKLLDQLAAFQPLPQQADPAEGSAAPGKQWPVDAPRVESQHSEPQHA
jgi:DNA-binding MarR family transcriptional regulator